MLKIIKSNKSKLILKYSAYFLILLFSVYFFILFFLPYGEIKKAAEETLLGKTGVKFTIAKAAYAFPFYISFRGIKLSNNRGTASYGSIKETKINVSPYVLAGLIFGTAPVNINMYNISLNGFNAGFMDIPPFDLKYASVALNVSKDKKDRGIVNLTGNIRFKGGLTGSIAGIDAAFYPRNGVLKFNGGALQLKPSAKTAKGLSVIFNTAFQKSGNGYYTYELKNRIF